jgi:hypothetical protein
VSPQTGPPHSVRQVIADVDLETGADKRAKVESFRQSDWAQKPAELSRIEQNILDPTKYLMRVTLTAELADGRRVTVPGFEFSGPRDGVGAIWFRYHGPQLHDDAHEHERLLNETYHVRLSDVEDAIDQMLGRNPEQHRPPRLSWGRLLEALASAGVRTSEQELITSPLLVELSDDARAELARD